jgi:hypothetical protein
MRQRARNQRGIASDKFGNLSLRMPHQRADFDRTAATRDLA